MLLKVYTERCRQKVKPYSSMLDAVTVELSLRPQVNTIQSPSGQFFMSISLSVLTIKLFPTFIIIFTRLIYSVFIVPHMRLCIRLYKKYGYKDMINANNISVTISIIRKKRGGENCL